MNEPPINHKFSWTAQEFDGKWYYYDFQGNPCGPYDTEEVANFALDDYADYWDRE